jgi:DNA polymerase-3 subunit beta
MKIYAQLNAIKAVSHLAATKDIRFYLNGILVEATKTHTTLVATDGHVLGVYKNEEENEIPENYGYKFILPKDALKNLKASFIKDELISLEFERDEDWNVKTVTIKSVSITLTTQTIAAKFPDWRRVLPRETTNELGHYNPELLTRFIKVAKEFGVKPHGITLHQNGTSAAAMTIDGIENFLGVVMPMRSNSVYTGCTRFLDEQPVTQEALAA